jgi:hypothetical protein
VKVSFKGDSIKMFQSLDRMGQKAPIAVMRALNRTIASANTQAVRAISADLGGIKQSHIRDGILVVRATPGKLEASLNVTGKRLPLIDFKAKQTATGVAYQLPTGRDFVPHAFIATMRSGHRGVFLRRGRKRLPIAELRGPSLPRVFTRERILAAVRASTKSEFSKNLTHEMSFLTKSA